MVPVLLYITYLVGLLDNKHRMTDYLLLFRPECFNRIQAGGVPGGVEAEE
jgi:hypothetical protein